MGTRILVIEPDSTLRSFICQLLDQAGHATRSAASPVAAMDCLQSATVDLVVTDLLFRESAAHPLHALREAFPELEIVAISDAPASTGYLRLAATLGARRALADPFLSRALRTRLTGLTTGVPAPRATLLYQPSRDGLPASE